MKLLNYIAIFVFLSGPFTFAGSDSSGGGNAVVCKTKKGEVAYLLDLYEAQSLGTEIKRSDVHFLDQARMKLEDLKLSVKNMGLYDPLFSKDPISGFGLTLNWYIENFGRAYKFTHDKLPPLNDYNPEILPVNCEIQRLALYRSEGNIIVSKPVWDLLGETDKAALIFHEGIYKIDRVLYGKKPLFEGFEAEKTGSDRSRKTIGYLFSKEKLPTVFDFNSKSKICTYYRLKYDSSGYKKPDYSIRTVVAWTLDKDNNPSMQFLEFPGELIYSPTQVVGKGMKTIADYNSELHDWREIYAYVIPTDGFPGHYDLSLTLPYQGQMVRFLDTCFASL